MASSQGLLLISVHPLSSQVLRCFVSPSFAYRESDTIVRGAVGSAVCSATMLVAISPVWLVWRVSGTFIARFSGWLSPNHTPLPLSASSLPFLIQELSVYVIIGSICWPCSSLGFWSRRAGSVGVSVKSVSTRKHSSSVPWAVIVGSNRISSPLAVFAHWFFSFWWCVRVRLSFRVCSHGLNLLCRLPTMFLVANAHL